MKKTLLGILLLSSSFSFAVENPEIAYEIKENNISIGFDWNENVSGTAQLKIEVNSNEYLLQTSNLNNGFLLFKDLKLNHDIKVGDSVRVKTDIDLINEKGESEKQNIMFYIPNFEMKKYGLVESTNQDNNSINITPQRITPENQDARREFIEIQRNVSRQLRRYDDSFKNEIISDLSHLQSLVLNLSPEYCEKLVSKHNRDLDKTMSKFKNLNISYLNDYKLKCN